MLDTNVQQGGARPFLAERRERLKDVDFGGFEVAPMSPTIGAEVRGVHLAGEHSDAAIAEIRRALVEYKVLVFRDQRVDVAGQAAFASRFGELEEHPFLPANTEHPHVIHFAKDENVQGYENIWHSDVSWRLVPSLGSVLRAIEVGGDTLWSDMEAAYEGLSDAIKERIEGRTATHDFAHSFGRMLTPEQLEERRKEFPPAHHPIVRTHPESGRKCLYVNPIFTSHIDDMDEGESRMLLSHLYQHAKTPEYQCRLVWQPGTVAFWDNRSTQHYAVSDYWPHRRVMERVTIIGDTPA